MSPAFARAMQTFALSFASLRFALVAGSEATHDAGHHAKAELI